MSRHRVVADLLRGFLPEGARAGFDHGALEPPMASHGRSLTFNWSEIYFQMVGASLSIGRWRRSKAKLFAGIEVKASATVTAADLKGLRRLAAGAGDRFIGGIVLYDHHQAVRFDERTAAVPISALWA